MGTKLVGGDWNVLFICFIIFPQIYREQRARLKSTKQVVYLQPNLNCSAANFTGKLLLPANKHVCGVDFMARNAKTTTM